MIYHRLLVGLRNSMTDVFVQSQALRRVSRNSGKSGLHTLLKFFDLNAKVNQMWKILHNCEENCQQNKETDGFR